jgi:mRNA interferase MazF
VKRGEIWTAAGGPDYAGKPRPVVIIQDDAFDDTASITVCLSTTKERNAPLVRVPVEPNERTGLRQPSWAMVDKIMTVRKSRMGTRIGRVDDQDMVRLGRALIVFMGLAGSAS